MRADRLLSLMLILRARGRMRAEELATELEVSERTIYRDVGALMMAGVPVYTRAGNDGGIFMDENYRLSLTGLSKSEIQALFMLGGVGRPLKDLGLGRAAEDSALKLMAALPAVHRGEVERLRQRFYLDPDSWFQRNQAAPFLSEIQRAVWEDRTIEISYQNRRGEVSRQKVCPYGLVAKSNTWYVVGAAEGGDIRSWRVSRILEFTLTEIPFERPADFDLVEFWQSNSRTFEQTVLGNPEPCTVLLRLHPDYLWMFAGDYERLEDVDGWAVLRVEYVSFEAARLSILALGEYAVVLEPAILRDRIMQSARGMLDNYGE